MWPSGPPITPQSLLNLLLEAACWSPAPVPRSLPTFFTPWTSYRLILCSGMADLRFLPLQGREARGKGVTIRSPPRAMRSYAPQTFSHIILQPWKEALLAPLCQMGRRRCSCIKWQAYGHKANGTWSQASVFPSSTGVLGAVKAGSFAPMPPKLRGLYPRFLSHLTIFCSSPQPIQPASCPT